MVETTRRREIENAASLLFHERGYSATSVRDIARAVDIQGASLYAHVASKQDVLWSIVEGTAARFEVAADAVEAADPGALVFGPGVHLISLVRAHVGVVTDDILNSEERADEFLLMGLRLTEGIDPRRYQALSGRSLDPRRIALLREEGAISVDADGRLRVTKEGFPVLDAVVADLAA